MDPNHSDPGVEICYLLSPNFVTMTWVLTIVILVLILLAWLLLSPIELEIDTASLRARLNWAGIGNANIWYDGQWWIFFRVFFYERQKALRRSRDAGEARDARGKDAEKAKDAGKAKDARENKRTTAAPAFYQDDQKPQVL